VNRIIAWGRSIVAYVFVGTYTVLVGPPALLVARVTGRSRHIFVVGEAGMRAFRFLLGVRVREEGADHVPGDRPAVYCFNHRSLIDGLLFDVMRRHCPGLRVLFKAEMTTWPILGPLMLAAGCVPVERTVRDRAHAAVDLATQRLAGGCSFLLAPEGTRSDTDTMGPFKRGAFVMAIQAQVPVVPVAIVGAGALMPRGQRCVKPGQVVVRYGAPVSTAGLTIGDREELARRVRNDIQRLLNQR
jgi:1-acyl-sn-glycerol-3-phosphate acyltransferase